MTHAGVFRRTDASHVLDAGLNHSVLAAAVTGARHVALKDERRFDFVELLKEPLVLRREEQRQLEGDSDVLLWMDYIYGGPGAFVECGNSSFCVKFQV